MSELVQCELTKRVAIITIDNPPVNALSPAVWEALDHGICSSRNERSLNRKTCQILGDADCAAVVAAQERDTPVELLR